MNDAKNRETVFTYDGLPRLISADLDAAGLSLMTEFLYDAAGNIRFPGQYYDAETGLHYNRFRYYDPSIGRYVSADPIGQFGGANSYWYVGNQPTAFADPLGLIPPGWFRRNVQHQAVPPTDAEGDVATLQAGTGLQAAGIAGLASGEPRLRAAGLAAAIAGTMMAESPDPDGDNDNDGVPDSSDTDDDNDGIPDLIDPSPLIPCFPLRGECYTPSQNSCGPSQ